MIKSIKLFPNSNTISMEAMVLIRDRFIKNGFIISDNSYDLAIAIGGDGAFLRMIRENKFISDIYYMGINTGTLGFSMDINLDEVDKLIMELQNGSFREDIIDIQETEVVYENQSEKFYSMNEIIIRDINLGAVKLYILINGEFLEKFVGDGILVSTPFGSTAHNLSCGGSIVYNDISSLQITPMSPISSAVYKSFTNSIIIPSGYTVSITPLINKAVIITVDGVNKKYENVDRIETRIADKKIRCLRPRNYNFTNKINKKILG